MTKATRTLRPDINSVETEGTFYNTDEDQSWCETAQFFIRFSKNEKEIRLPKGRVIKALNAKNLPVWSRDMDCRERLMMRNLALLPDKQSENNIDGELRSDILVIWKKNGKSVSVMESNSCIETKNAFHVLSAYDSVTILKSEVDRLLDLPSRRQKNA